MIHTIIMLLLGVLGCIGNYAKKNKKNKSYQLARFLIAYLLLILICGENNLIPKKLFNDILQIPIVRIMKSNTQPKPDYSFVTLSDSDYFTMLLNTDKSCRVEVGEEYKFANLRDEGTFRTLINSPLYNQKREIFDLQSNSLLLVATRFPKTMPITVKGTSKKDTIEWVEGGDYDWHSKANSKADKLFVMPAWKLDKHYGVLGLYIFRVIVLLSFLVVTDRSIDAIFNFTSSIGCFKYPDIDKPNS